MARGYIRPPPAAAAATEKSLSASLSRTQIGQKASSASAAASASAKPKQPAELKTIPVGDARVRSKLRFEVVTAKVVETAGKKHVVGF